MVYDCVEFRGVAKKARIISNRIGYGPMPEPSDDAEQRMTITADGRVWLTSYAYGDVTKYILQEQKRMRDTPEVGQALLDATGRYFSNNPIVAMATDVGDWRLELTNSDGDRYRYSGSLVEDRTGLSDFIRKALNLPYLWVFDGGKIE